MLSPRSALAFAAILLWAIGLVYVWLEMPIIPAPPYDIDRAGKIFLLNGVLAFGLVLTPAAIIIRAWLRRGHDWRLALEAPMLWALGGIVLLAMNAVSEIVSPWIAYPRGSAMQDAIYVVAHFRHVLHLGAIFAGFAAFYFLFPKVTDWTYSAFLARLQFGFQFVGVNFGLLPLYFFKFDVAAYNYAEANNRLESLRHLTGLGAVITTCGMLIFAGLVVEALVRKRPVAAAH